MKIASESLRALIERVAPAADPKGSQVICRMVRLTYVEGVGLSAEATDLYRCARGRDDSAVGGGGFDVCVEASALAKFTKAIPNGHTATVSVKGEKLVIASSSRRVSLPTQPADDFPPWPTAQSESVTVDTASLADHIGAVRHAAGDDGQRAHLAGVHVHGAVVVATDGHRLSRAEAMESRMGAARGVTIPGDSLGLILDMIGAGCQSLTVTPARAFASTGTHDVAVMLVQEDFPPYAQVIPAPGGKPVTVNVEALADALRYVALAEGRGCIVALRADGETLGLSSRGETLAETTVEITPAADWQVCANASYLLEAVQAAHGLGAETVELEVTAELDPIVVRASGLTEVIMPVRA